MMRIDCGNGIRGDGRFVLNNQDPGFTISA
jgi:hypothetical protein